MADIDSPNISTPREQVISFSWIPGAINITVYDRLLEIVLLFTRDLFVELLPLDIRYYIIIFGITIVHILRLHADIIKFLLNSIELLT